MPVRLELRRDANRIGPHAGPWVFRKDVASIQGPPDPLTLAQVINHRHEVLGHALYSPESEIIGRIVQWGEEPPPSQWLSQRIAAAVRARQALGLASAADTTGYRLINSEGDRLPGLVADRYGDHIVAQLTTAPMVALQPLIVALLQDACPLQQVIVVKHEKAARAEGFASGVEHLAAPVSSLAYRENGLALTVPAPPAQQKTGGYHDQRDNRQRIVALAQHTGAPLLELGCHVAGFALHAAARGVRSVGVDLSDAVLARAQANADANQIGDVQWVKADLFAPLVDSRLAGPFGCIVLDPPKMSSQRRERDNAVTVLRRVIHQVAGRLTTDGFLVVCSCSHHLGLPQLDEAVTGEKIDRLGLTRAALFGPGLDHPVQPGHLGGEYLRVAVYQRRGL